MNTSSPNDVIRQARKHLETQIKTPLLNNDEIAQLLSHSRNQAKQVPKSHLRRFIASFIENIESSRMQIALAFSFCVLFASGLVIFTSRQYEQSTRETANILQQQQGMRSGKTFVVSPLTSTITQKLSQTSVVRSRKKYSAQPRFYAEHKHSITNFHPLQYAALSIQTPAYTPEQTLLSEELSIKAFNEAVSEYFPPTQR